MIDALFNQPNFLAAKRLLDATALRHEAITSNLGHLETLRPVCERGSSAEHR